VKGFHFNCPLAGLTAFVLFFSVVAPVQGARQLLPNEFWRSGGKNGAYLETGDPLEALLYHCKVQYSGKKVRNVTAYYRNAGSWIATPDGDGDIVSYKAICESWKGGGSVRADKKGCGPGGHRFDEIFNECRPNEFDKGLIAGQCPPDLLVGSPINIATGNKFLRVPVIPGSGASPISLNVFFNSSKPANIYWLHNYESRWIGGWSGSKVTYTKGGYNYRYYIAKFLNSDGSVSIFKGMIDPATYKVRWKSYSNAEETLESLWDPQTNARVAVVLRRPNGRADTYGLSGELIQRTEPDGKNVYLTYDSSGELASVRDDWGREMQLSSAEGPQGGRELSVQWAGSEWRLQYEGERLTAIHFPGDPAVNKAFLYEDPDHPNYLTGMIDERGIRTHSWQYDSVGRATLSTQHGSGFEYSVDYPSAFEREVMTPLGAARSYSLSPRNGYAQIESRSGGVCHECTNDTAALTYDLNGYPATQQDQVGNTTALQHDEQGHLTERTDAAGTADERSVKTNWHPVFRKPTKIIEPGRTIHLTYNEKGQLTSRRLEAITQ